MVMSEEGEVLAAGRASPGLARERVSDREKELAGDASGAFTKGDYAGCLNSLEKLEVRPQIPHHPVFPRSSGRPTASSPTTRS
jgi:hypothetical protein